MTALLVLGGLGVALALPHAVFLDRASPTVAALVWLAALLLRATIVASVAVFAFVVAPATDLFHAITHFCWHTVVPLVTAHLGVSGHLLADAAVLVPAIIVLWSLIAVVVALARAAGRVRRILASGIGHGPRDSVIVADGQVLLAAAGVRRPQVIVSAGALTQLDDDELSAGLEHEHGHIARRHRWVLLFAQVVYAIGRPIPGAGRALAELGFHLERDADRFALDRQHTVGDLASAICKAAGAGTGFAPAMPLSGSGAARRVRHLLRDEEPAGSAMTPRLVATALVSLTATILVFVGPATAAVARTLPPNQPVVDCPD